MWRVRGREMHIRISAELKDIYHRYSPNVEENQAIFTDKLNRMQYVIRRRVLSFENPVGHW